MKPSDKLRELGFGNQAVIVGTKRKELFGVVDKLVEEERKDEAIRIFKESGGAYVNWNEKARE